MIHLRPTRTAFSNEYFCRKLILNEFEARLQFGVGHTAAKGPAGEVAENLLGIGLGVDSTQPRRACRC